ncbi:hypothetical protein [Clostridium chauvoei]|uniref:Cell division protein FtsL n=2 Tax=Clostridium chauvoei TaxID=46867 RepID=A0A1U6JEK4_9CLOT|nr:hypothetical protein [Clostridium chauvoei]ATD55230.1 hypothetical protein BTM20_08235 [Clostridium chauvoei]ATD57098.1 hypothetical protein BTM21_04805 [Clostridium chauvoei]MBX7279574.1 cell division protein FtsL [Clostridium chauvoei]MBX7281943.1 cell division protein FtsL [Clostridium chauvoei]MBX7284468.1 cell division protein FtsL [Clostridium chauvoei]
MGEREYDYIRGNTAINPRRDYGNPAKDKSVREKQKIKRQKNKHIQKVKNNRTKGILQLSAVIFILGVATISRNGQIYNMQHELTTLKGEIKKEISNGEAIRVDLLKYASLDKIRSSATGTLKMTAPDKNSTITVDISKNYFPNITDETNTQKESKNIFSKLMDALN